MMQKEPFDNTQAQIVDLPNVRLFFKAQSDPKIETEVLSMQIRDSAIDLNGGNDDETSFMSVSSVNCGAG